MNIKYIFSLFALVFSSITFAHELCSVKSISKINPDDVLPPDRGIRLVISASQMRGELFTAGTINSLLLVNKEEIVISGGWIKKGMTTVIDCRFEVKDFFIEAVDSAFTPHERQIVRENPIKLRILLENGLTEEVKGKMKIRGNSSIEEFEHSFQLVGNN